MNPMHAILADPGFYATFGACVAFIGLWWGLAHRPRSKGQ